MILLHKSTGSVNHHV